MRESHYDNLSAYLKQNCSSIEQLSVRGIWFKDRSNSLFIDALRRMPRLQVRNNSNIVNLAGRWRAWRSAYSRRRRGTDLKSCASDHSRSESKQK